MSQRRAPDGPGSGFRRVLVELDRALDELEPLPPSLIAAAQAAYTWHTVDAELLELLTDSAADELLLVRASPERRLLVFGGPKQAVQFEVSPAALDGRGDGCEVVGFVSSPGPGCVVRAEWQEGSADETCDQGGGFAFAALPAERVRFVVRDESGVAFVTPWVDLGD